MAWVTQTPIADRTREKLGESDTGIILLRKMLNEAMETVADGGDPMNVFRDPATNQCIEMTQEKVYYTPDRNQARMIYYGHQAYNPKIDEIVAMFPE
jgi:5,5'-dehydrodivanillate O-demethylase